MKIPRFTRGPCSYTLEKWAKQMAISDLIFGIPFAIILFYLTTKIDSFFYTHNLDPEAINIVKTFCIGVGVLFCVIVLFATILITGLQKNIIKLLLIWCYFALIASVTLFIFLLALSINAFVINNTIFGLIILALAVLVTGHEIYSGLIVYSIYLNIKEEEENHTSLAQH